MEKIKLSDLIAYYEQKVQTKDDFFGLYFEEYALESKLFRLKLMYETLGDISMPLDYFKVFLYSGHWYGNKDHFELTKSMIIDIYDIIKKYDDIPIEMIDSLLFHYDKECFEKCYVKEYIDSLVIKHKFTEETKTKCINYIEDSKKELKDFYLNESDKLNLIKDEYPYYFINDLKSIMLRRHIIFEELMKVLPSNALFKPTGESKIEFWDKYNDYRFIYELLKGKINLDDYEDDDYMESFKQIGQSSDGIVITKMYTSFTKKEYLESIKEKQKVLKK